MMPSVPATAQQVVDSSFGGLVGEWWVAETRPRYEARLCRELEAAEASAAIAFEEPVVRTHTDARGHRHRRLETRPLFPRYVFFCGTDKHRDVASGSRCTSRVIDVCDQRRLVKELDRLQWAVGCRTAELQRLGAAAELRSGRRVEIVDGALAGLRGVVDKALAGGRLIRLKCTILGKDTPVEIPPEMVAAADLN